MGSALKRVSGQLRDAIRETFAAAWHKVVTFSVAVWGFFIQVYRAVEEFLTGLILIVRFPALGIGLLWAGLASGVWLVTAAGVAWLLLLGIAFAFFRERGEPHPESALVLTIAKWSARAILVATALAVTYITNPGIKPPFLGGETVSEGQMNRGSLLSRPKSAPAKVRPTVKAKVVSSGNPERQLRPTQVTGPSTTKSTVKKPAPRNVASAPPKVSGPREGVDPFSSDASPN